MMRGCEERRIAPAGLRLAVEGLLAAGGRMQMLYARTGSDGSELNYLASAGRDFVLLRLAVGADAVVPSLAPRVPLLGWYEREVRDLYGLDFAGHPEPHPLLVTGWEGPGPLAGRGRAPVAGLRAPWVTPAVEGEGVQMLPFGPVRADVLESAQFLFFYLGEGILRYEPRLFFKHRGVEDAFAGRPPEAGVVLAERVSGVGSLAHALAYCQAVEQAAECEVPPAARWWRSVLAELERLYNHFHYFGQLADTTTLKVGQAEGRLLEERVKQLCARVCGSRFLRGVLTPGGLRRTPALPQSFASELRTVCRDGKRYLAALETTNSYLDRLMTTGVLPRQTAFDQGATGPVERASGLDRDLRRDHPYAGYVEFKPTVPVREAGDAHARAEVRAAEIESSFEVLEQLLAHPITGPLRAECAPPPHSEGLGWAESPRGSLFYAVHLGADGRLARVKIKSPSFSNWRVFPFTVQDSNMMDYAINEASFGLTVAGCAR